MTRKDTETLTRNVFERLVREHHAAVYASALRILRSAESALDVTQDVYLALLEGRIVLSGTDDERVLRWFAVRGSLQVLREGRTRRQREESVAMEQPETTFDASVQAADTTSAVERFVAKLPDDMRAAVHLRFHEGLTFARIGEALEISEPAAHERVKRALERLKDALSRAGLAAVAIDLEQTLASTSAAPPVPLYVAKKLVALHSGAASVSIATALIGSVLVVAAWVVVVPQFFGEHPRETEVAVVSSTPEPPAQGTQAFQVDSPLVTGARTSAASVLRQEAGSNVIVLEPVETNGVIVGRVLDAKNRPVQDLVVIASSIEREGKFSRWAARGKTEGDGRFLLRATVGEAGATNYAIGVEGGAEIHDRSRLDQVRVPSDGQVDVGDVRLEPRYDDLEGDFELSLHLSDATGNAVADTNASIFRKVRLEDGGSNGIFEASAKSDALGRAFLTGRHVGKKHVVVDARDLGFRRHEHLLELAPGKHTLSLTLEKGLEIRGRLVDVDGRAILRPPGESHFGDVLQLHAVMTGDNSEWIFAAIEDDGAFTFRGLEPVAYDLEISRGPWSSICLDGVRAGSSDVLITLKRRDDPLDRGHHCAEIHARMVDEATREAVLLDVMNSEVVTLDRNCTPAAFDADEVASLLNPMPRQTEWSGEYPPRSDRVHVASLQPGTYALVIRAPGYAPEFAAPIALGPHEIRNDLVLSLTRPTRLRGRVLDVDGKPCGGAFVLVNGTGPKSTARLAAYDRDVVETDGNPRATWDLVRTDTSGVFVIEGLSPRHDYRVDAVHLHHAPVSSARIAGRDPGVVELRFTTKR